MYADIIVDISHENLDKTYQYSIPLRLLDKAVPGAQVYIPFGKGNRVIKGYIVEVSEQANYAVEKLKEITDIVKGAVVVESQLIALAFWMKEHYGGTMNEALKTVMPVKSKVKELENKCIRLKAGTKEASLYLAECRKKKYKAQIRLLEALIPAKEIAFQTAGKELMVPASTLKALVSKNMIEIASERTYRNPVAKRTFAPQTIVLNEQQKKAVDSMVRDFNLGIRKTYLLHGITGSGKTQVYMSMIESVIKDGGQVIMLIPEIALTFQTVMRFYQRFKDRVSVLHSRLSKGERYDQYVRAKNGDIDIMIGPRSALFTPFDHLKLIILDEEHEGSYKSESNPRYHARETAMERARMTNASVVLGSATPSVESYKKAMDGEYGYFELTIRAGKGTVPAVWISDLREELKNKNRSIFSRKLKELITDRLSKKEQTMLFINRRGYAGFISCRSCGHVITCPHCDVSLKSHNNGILICHYCGYEEPFPSLCPVCGSKYIAAFGTGTQKVEEYVMKEFQTARVLRMDLDTTKGKNGHEKILKAFQEGEADILVGTQMIVKGHDFANVTLVGILAADLSLYANDYRAAEKTYQLLSQAAGRAGRGFAKGEVVIQTYNPDHYSIKAAAQSDYLLFYKEEMAFRTAMDYPPAFHLLLILVSGKLEEQVVWGMDFIYRQAAEAGNHLKGTVKMVGPAKASVSKINDMFRRVLYIKNEEYSYLIEIKNRIYEQIEDKQLPDGIFVQFDFDPQNSY